MEAWAQHDDEKWGEVMKHLDLLFAKVGDIDTHQHNFEAWFDMSSGGVRTDVEGPTEIGKADGSYKARQWLCSH